jgi:NTE family protein
MRRADYSRSDRIGELYDEYFYRPALDPDRQSMIEMSKLKIIPKGGKPDFYPLKENGPRSAKVPILLINATTLNTGHNWRFEASRMGEPSLSSPEVTEIDKNLRLRTIASGEHDFELGFAVAASACVPGIFHPLAAGDLYPGIRVQLVDGGVHDNQGLQGLLDRGCTRFILSDASGQMDDDPDPATKITAVIGRTNSILMDRVREEQLIRKLEMDESRVAVMHLRKGLSATVVSWTGAHGAAEEPTIERKPRIASEDFGVSPEVQLRLSKIRTDLDSFTEVEAYSLMADGYLMSREELRRPPEIAALIAKKKRSASEPWRFLRISPWLSSPTDDYRKQLEVGSELVFKIFRLSPAVTIVTIAVVAGLCVGAFILLKDNIFEFLNYRFYVGELVVALVVLALGFIPKLGRIFKILRVLRAPAEYVGRLLLRALPAAIGSLFVWIHLFIYDPLFLRHGKLERLRPPA